jgi:hypothetical protein
MAGARTETVAGPGCSRHRSRSRARCRMIRHQARGQAHHVSIEKFTDDQTAVIEFLGASSTHKRRPFRIGKIDARAARWFLAHEVSQ